MNRIVEKTYEFIKEKQMGECTGHDWWHTYRVYQMAIRLAKAQTEPVNPDVVMLGALLHDIEDWKFNGGDEEAGPNAAEQWLRANGGDEELILHIREIIRDLSFKGTGSKSMKTLEGKIVQDADRLDAVGAVGIARCFAFGGAFGNEIYNPQIPVRVGISEKEYKSREEKSTTVNHFFEKLFLLKDLYNTEEAKRIGNERDAYMRQFMRQFLTDCQGENSQQFELLELL